MTVPARVAAWLNDKAALDRLRVRVRGDDPEVDAVLITLRVAGNAFSAAEGSGGQDATCESAAVGTGSATSGPPTEEWFSVRDAATQLRMTPRGVREAIRTKRLHGERFSGVWRISGADIQAFARGRKAAA